MHCTANRRSLLERSKSRLCDALEISQQIALQHISFAQHVRPVCRPGQPNWLERHSRARGGGLMRSDIRQVGAWRAGAGNSQSMGHICAGAACQLAQDLAGRAEDLGPCLLAAHDRRFHSSWGASYLRRFGLGNTCLGVALQDETTRGAAGEQLPSQQNMTSSSLSLIWKPCISFACRDDMALLAYAKVSAGF